MLRVGALLASTLLITGHIFMLCTGMPLLPEIIVPQSLGFRRGERETEETEQEKETERDRERERESCSVTPLKTTDEKAELLGA